MRYGVFLGDSGYDLAALTAEMRAVRAAGLASAWMNQIFSTDALTALAVCGSQVPGLELGTGVVPTYPRHPMTLALQALSTQAAVDGRLVLGIGVSHQVVIEGLYNMSFARPLSHMREYLSILVPLLRDRRADFRGETLSWSGAIEVPGAMAPPVLVAALGPRMLELAGTVADGTITWMTGPATIEGHIAPTIGAAAARAGRPAPRVVVGLPLCLTEDPVRARERAASTFAMYANLPSYRAMLDREGVAGPADVAVIGDEAAVSGQLDRLAAGGATDFVAALLGTPEEKAGALALLGARS